jgi:hypothetical protein
MVREIFGERIDKYTPRIDRSKAEVDNQAYSDEYPPPLLQGHPKKRRYSFSLTILHKGSSMRERIEVALPVTHL